MTQDNQALDINAAGHLARVRSDVAQFILDLNIEGFDLGIDAAFNNKLWQVCAAHQREIDRQQQGDPGSPKVFERVEVFTRMAMLLAQRLIDHIDGRRSKGMRATAEERKTVRILTAVLEQFDRSQDELAQRFPQPDMSNLAQKIWFNFYNVSAAECELDAAAIAAMKAVA